MTQILSACTGILLIMLLSLGYMYKGLEKDYAESQAEVQIKEQSINNLKDSISHQNDEIDKLKIDVANKQIIYKDKIQYITKTVEVQKQDVATLQGQADCDKAKEIANGIF